MSFTPHDDFDAPETPDLTRPIMARLGYMRARPEVTRRRRLRRRATRSTLLSAAVAIVAASTIAYHAGPHARRSLDQTIPAALGDGVRQHQQDWGRTLQMIRDLAPAPATPCDVECDDGAELNAVGPVRWL